MLVCPVTTPMYYGKNSKPIADAKKSREVYLPEGVNWFDFLTNEVQAGGQTITADAPLDKMPLFIKAGSILSIGPQVQYAMQAEREFEIILVKDGVGGLESGERKRVSYKGSTVQVNL